MLGNSGIVVIDKFFSCLVCMTSIERKACMMVVVVVMSAIATPNLCDSGPCKSTLCAIVDSGERRHLEV